VVSCSAAGTAGDGKQLMCSMPCAHCLVDAMHSEVSSSCCKQLHGHSCSSRTKCLQAKRARHASSRQSSAAADHLSG
jgi:hypothetical protein